MTKINPETQIELNIFSENTHKEMEVDEKKAITVAKKLLQFYLNEEDILRLSCLFEHEFNCLSFDILFCDDEMTHNVNREYRQKNYPADIITFAIFADGEEKFVFDDEINLGEVIISLDKVAENANYKNISFEEELNFLISHGIMHLLGFDHQTEEEYNFIIEAQNAALEWEKGKR